jgi:hypothetical protein
MNDVCDLWSSPWAALQKTLAKAPAPTSMPGGALGGVSGRVSGGLPRADTWLDRARHSTTWKPVHSAAAPAL